MSALCLRALILVETCVLGMVCSACDNGAGGTSPNNPPETGIGTGGIGGGSTNPGGAPNSGGSGNPGGTSSLGTSSGTNVGTGGATVVAPGSYALNPPQQCNNQFYVPNCTPGVATSACGGKCSSINACQESTASKPGDDVTFLCPRFTLFGDEMMQAAVDDGNSAFNYAVVGHDVDTNGIDGTAQTVCCQCYQLIFDYPKENQANQNASATGPSAIPLPPPLIVQAFNTGTNGPDDFDVFMGAGGYGGNNACDPNFSMKSTSGLYMYTAFPPDGESGQGGVKGAGIYSECKTTIQWVTTDSLASAACQTKISAACNLIASNSPTVTSETIKSCIKSNDPNSYYHLNWNVHAKKVECPTHLTEVTGCKLASQGLPAVNRNVTTSAQAAADSSFKATAANGNHFSTTTMQDCCKPTCAWQDKVSGLGLAPVGKYNSFYSCNQNGVPITE